MAHFAKIENNVVTQVLRVPDAYETDGQGYLNGLGLDGEWVQTSYNNNIRGVFASVGFTYDREADKFKPPQPYASWIFDKTQWGWKAPIEVPANWENFEWDEAAQAWVEL